RLVPTRPALEGATVRRLRQRRKQLRCALRRERIGKSEQIRIATEAGCPGGERGLSDGHLGRSGKGCVRKGLQGDAVLPAIPLNGENGAQRQRPQCRDSLRIGDCSGGSKLVTEALEHTHGLERG